MIPRSQMRQPVLTLLAIGATLGGAAEPMAAQDNPAPIIEALVGRSGFVDEVWDGFTTIGAGARVFVTPRLAIGSEVAYLSSAADAQEASNLAVTGTVTFDFVRDNRQRFIPYFAAGAGYLRQRTLVGGGPGSTTLVPYTSSEGTVSGGIGVRMSLTSRLFIAPEFRLGWEPETRIAVMIGMRAR